MAGIAVFVAVGETGTGVLLAVGAINVGVALGRFNGVAVAVGASGVGVGAAWVVDSGVDVIGAEGESVDIVAV